MFGYEEIVNVKSYFLLKGSGRCIGLPVCHKDCVFIVNSFDFVCFVDVKVWRDTATAVSCWLGEWVSLGTRTVSKAVVLKLWGMPP